MSTHTANQLRALRALDPVKLPKSEELRNKARIETDLSVIDKKNRIIMSQQRHTPLKQCCLKVNSGYNCPTLIELAFVQCSNDEDQLLDLPPVVFTQITRKISFVAMPRVEDTLRKTLRFLVHRCSLGDDIHHNWMTDYLHNYLGILRQVQHMQEVRRHYSVVTRMRQILKYSQEIEEEVMKKTKFHMSLFGIKALN